MRIACLGFSGLKYLFNKGVKVAQKVLPKVSKGNHVPSKAHIEFIRKTSIYDPNSFDFIHKYV